MNKKLIAVLMAAVVVCAGVGVYFAMSDKPVDVKDTGLSVLARVNTEGSGIYVKHGENLSDYIEADGKTLKASGFAGKIFGTPGPSTIQHMQLKELVEDKLHLKYAMYEAGQALKADSVYYDSGVANYTTFKSAGKSYLTGAIIWQI